MGSNLRSNIAGSLIAWGVIAVGSFALHRWFGSVPWEWWLVGGGGLGLVVSGLLLRRLHQAIGPPHKSTGTLKQLMSQMQAELRDLIDSDTGRGGGLPPPLELQTPRGTTPQARQTDPSVIDPSQVRRAIDRASAQLRKQRQLVWEWRLHQHLEPDDRGEWETEDRKGLLHQDPRLHAAYHATEDAFNAISLMQDPTSFHRDNALAKIDIALKELDAAAHVIDRAPLDGHTR